MSILPPATVAHGRDQIAKLNIAVPERLLSPGDQETWQYYASCLPPDRLIAKFAECLDQFHALVQPIRLCPESLDQAGRDTLLSKWNAAAMMGTIVVERFGYELPINDPGLGDAISEGLYFIRHMLHGMNHPSVQGWIGRETYYNDLDSMIMQDIRDDYFARQNDLRYGRKSPGLCPS